MFFAILCSGYLGGKLYILWRAEQPPLGPPSLSLGPPLCSCCRDTLWQTAIWLFVAAFLIQKTEHSPPFKKARPVPLAQFILTLFMYPLPRLLIQFYVGFVVDADVSIAPSRVWTKNPLHLPSLRGPTRSSPTTQVYTFIYPNQRFGKVAVPLEWVSKSSPIHPSTPQRGTGEQWNPKVSQKHHP